MAGLRLSEAARAPIPPATSARSGGRRFLAWLAASPVGATGGRPSASIPRRHTQKPSVNQWSFRVGRGRFIIHILSIGLSQQKQKAGTNQANRVPGRCYTMRFFFDYSTADRSLYDFRGDDFQSSRDAIEFAQVTAEVLKHSLSDDWTGVGCRAVLSGQEPFLVAGQIERRADSGLGRGNYAPFRLGATSSIPEQSRAPTDNSPGPHRRLGFHFISRCPATRKNRATIDCNWRSAETFAKDSSAWLCSVPIRQRLLKFHSKVKHDGGDSCVSRVLGKSYIPCRQHITASPRRVERPPPAPGGARRDGARDHRDSGQNRRENFFPLRIQHNRCHPTNQERIADLSHSPNRRCK
jgi:hypothetical protein